MNFRCRRHVMKFDRPYGWVTASSGSTWIQVVQQFGEVLQRLSSVGRGSSHQHGEGRSARSSAANASGRWGKTFEKGNFADGTKMVSNAMEENGTAKTTLNYVTTPTFQITR